MLSSQVNIIDALSYRQIQGELKKRRLNSTGNKIAIVKRLKFAYESEIKNQTSNVTKFCDLPNEIYREIFDYLCSYNIIHSFYGLNHRLNQVIGDIPMALNMRNLNQNEYKRALKHVVPKIINQTMSISIGELSRRNRYLASFHTSELFIDLFLQSYNLTEFLNLRCLSLASPNQAQLESILSIVPTMSSLRSLRLFEESYHCKSHETVCKLMLANNSHYSLDQHKHLTHFFIETSPPFMNILLLRKHFINKISFDCIQINVRCSSFYYTQASTFIDYTGLSSMVPNMTYLKMDMKFGIFQIMFDIIHRFPTIQHLSVKGVPQVYANGYQWAELLAEMPNITKFDLDIYLDSHKFSQELETFQTKFWLERQWIVQLIESRYLNSSKYKIIHRSI